LECNNDGIEMGKKRKEIEIENDGEEAEENGPTCSAKLMKQ